MSRLESVKAAGGTATVLSAPLRTTKSNLGVLFFRAQEARAFNPWETPEVPGRAQSIFAIVAQKHYSYVFMAFLRSFESG